MPIGFSNKPVLWRMDGGRKIRSLLWSFRLSIFLFFLIISMCHLHDCKVNQKEKTFISKNIGIPNNLIKSRFFKNRELYWSNLPQNSSLGRESFVQKFGVQIPVGEGQIFCHFSFLILSMKIWILKHKLLFCILTDYIEIEIKFHQHTYFYWYLTGKSR